MVIFLCIGIVQSKYNANTNLNNICNFQYPNFQSKNKICFKIYVTQYTQNIAIQYVINIKITSGIIYLLFLMLNLQNQFCTFIFLQQISLQTSTFYMFTSQVQWLLCRTEQFYVLRLVIGIWDFILIFLKLCLPYLLFIHHIIFRFKATP